MKNQKGFTLIELLVVVAIIGILASIAIPAFADYKKRAFDARAISELRNVITSQEAYYVDNQSYAKCGNGLGSIKGGCELILPGFVSVDYFIEVTSSPNGEGFSADACHRKGTQQLYDFQNYSKESRHYNIIGMNGIGCPI